MPSQESPKSSQSGNTSGFDTTDHENLLHVEASASDFDFSGRGVAAGTTDDEIAMGLGGFTRERPDSDAGAQMLQSAGADDGKISVALLGRGTAAGMQMRLVFWLLLLMIAFGFVVFTILKDARSNSLQVAVAGQALTQSQRLAKAAPRALAGQREGLEDLTESAQVFDRAIRALSQGGSGVVPVAPEWRGARWEQMEELSQRTIANANRIVGQKDFLLRSGEAWLQAGQQVQPLHEAVEDVVAAKLERNAPAREIAAAGQLEVLAQRIGRVVSEFQSPEGMSPEASFLLNKDLVLFAEISEGLLNGNAELRLTPAGDEALKSLLRTAIGRFDALKENAGFIAANAQDAATLRNAEIGIDADSGPLRLALEELQGGLANRPAVVDWQMIAGAAILLLAFLVVIGFFRVQVKESRRLQAVVENDRRRAEAQEFEAKRVNDASQAAILRLMNELQAVAEGDLTQEATVTEDITGAIADSVNYTVEELRMLVGNVQNTATQVAQTTEQVETSATELLATSNEQLHEIRETGQAVLEMASRINGMSSQAQESAEVARQSLQAAETGLNAVQASIGGMNIIRDQIQETSKRIKRLGESSQEIGEITELISDITEQTNVLALNAAIQAASAGEAGRGFSVVAEEVQRLAERSADATRQIAALVKTIQTDTQDAVSAMERSTKGVVDGAKLSDSAGTALAEIDRVSRRLADLIAQISSASAREASLASDVADNIQHIFAVTEQTSDSTRTSAQQVRELAVIADELRQSVARFKIA